MLYWKSSFQYAWDSFLVDILKIFEKFPWYQQAWLLAQVNLTQLSLKAKIIANVSTISI